MSHIIVFKSMVLKLLSYFIFLAILCASSFLSAHSKENQNRDVVKKKDGKEGSKTQQQVSRKDDKSEKQSKKNSIHAESTEKNANQILLASLKENKKDHLKNTSLSHERSNDKENNSVERTKEKSKASINLEEKNHQKKTSQKQDKQSTKSTKNKKPSSQEAPKREEVTELSRSVEEISFKEVDFSVVVRSNEFKQGNLGFFKIQEVTGKPKLDPSKITARWNGKFTPIYPFHGGYVGVLPIAPEHPKGISYLDIEKEETEKTVIYKFPISITETFFPERKMYNPLRVPKKYIIKEHSPETLEFIKKCEDKKQAVFSQDSEFKLSGKFVLPLDKIFVTSPFYVKRYYHPTHPGKSHGGVDLRGKPGVPIYAIQDGKVVIAERMFYEGIFTVIDHGSKIFSLYMHQSRTNVKEGDVVKAGDKIGEVGSTGISTGPHLHLGLKVDGEILNPLSVLELTLLK